MWVEKGSGGGTRGIPNCGQNRGSTRRGGVKTMGKNVSGQRAGLRRSNALGVGPRRRRSLFYFLLSPNFYYSSSSSSRNRETVESSSSSSGGGRIVNGLAPSMLTRREEGALIPGNDPPSNSPIPIVSAMTPGYRADVGTRHVPALRHFVSPSSKQE
ncbi:hypothetical protein EVAR_3709_1 [Eumeta japonica]|uniref:Uncharacterized protein n=1 Tax=Eumeta variegata TaxID=151549 RepID=A0A4C1SUP9_EUMVA|nr:hypothetical protein EVAR_3709_1 [Eumeta japonica]